MTCLWADTVSLHVCIKKSCCLSLQGLKFPWESAVSGREVCPADIYGQQEIHINGDVTLAFQRYLYLTEVQSFIIITVSQPV